MLGPNRRSSKVVPQHCCRRAADISFAKASEHRRALLAVRIAPETMRTRVEAHGKARAAFQPKDDPTGQAFRDAPGEVEPSLPARGTPARRAGKT